MRTAVLEATALVSIMDVSTNCATTIAPAKVTNLVPSSILNGPTMASFMFIFGLFKQTSLQFLQQINVKNVHPEYGAGN